MWEKLWPHLDFYFVHIELKESCGELADEHVHGLLELRHSVFRSHVHVWQDVQVNSKERGRGRGGEKRREG